MATASDHPKELPPKEVYDFFLMRLSRAAWRVVRIKLEDDQQAELKEDLNNEAFELLLRNKLQKLLNVWDRTVREWFQNQEKSISAGYIILVAHLFGAARELGLSICESRSLIRRALRETATYVREQQSPDDAAGQLSEDEILVLIYACRYRADQIAKRKPPEWKELCKFVKDKTKVDYGREQTEQLLERWLHALYTMIALFPFLRSGPI